MSYHGRILILNLATIALFIFDRITKWLMLKKTSYKRSFLFLKIEFQKNNGLWGIEFNKYFLLTTIILILIILILLLIKNYQKQNFFLISVITLILAGAFSNLVDRLIYDGVIDFINLFSFSTFNLADCLIVGGIGLWVIKEFFLCRQNNLPSGD